MTAFQAKFARLSQKATPELLTLPAGRCRLGSKHWKGEKFSHPVSLPQLPKELQAEGVGTDKEE